MPKSKELSIRIMNENDLQTVLTIEQASFPLPWKQDHFLHEIAAAHSYPFIAECGGIIVGYVCLTSLFEEAQILDIAVAPDQRGSGIARMLMEFAIGVARDKEAVVMSLEVRSTNNAAISLYDRLGFVRTGCRSRYYEGKDDAVLMEKNLQGESSCSLHP
jgi:ribosomal-protein-alanine N-acetyltransferase